MPGGRPSEPNIWKHFTKYRDPSTSSISTQCNYCLLKRSGASTARLKAHLEACPRYIGTQEELIQSRIRPPRITDFSTSNEATRLFVQAIALSGIGLSTFDKPWWKEFFITLNRTWKQPLRTSITTTWIPVIYQEIKTELDTFLESQSLINITAYESSDIAHHRILNTCIHFPEISFHWKSQDIGSNSATAEALAKWVGEQATELCQEEYKKLNSFRFDTNSTMRAASNLLVQDTRFTHCFFVLCASHGLQLLVKDIIQIQPIQSYLQKAQLIVTFFKSRKLQKGKFKSGSKLL